MSRPTNHTTRSRGRAMLAVGFLIGATLLLALVLTRGSGATLQAAYPPAAPAPAPHFVDVSRQTDASMRTLVIGSATDRLPGTSNAEGFLMANLRTGMLPAGAATALVLSDANCDPDKDGVSHCLNQLQIGTSVVTVQHHHQMHLVPCLTPGETVKLMPLAAYQG